MLGYQATYFNLLEDGQIIFHSSQFSLLPTSKAGSLTNPISIEISDSDGVFSLVLSLSAGVEIIQFEDLTISPGLLR